MSYTALARKWRPKKFSELSGQEHVVQALTHALETNRVHHAFLFAGTRGVGKTTLARILAKCLNCELRGVGADPCGECPSCREIDQGRFVDLIEVDAASRTKVDDTRELLDNVQYAPTRGRYKVYLIDEVHMLSSHSFNALLKTLEEPPPHVKFLLATTDPQKLPVTVLSRCLQFNLKRLPVSLISARMREILEAEGIAFDAAGVRLVAQAADGSMRDGLSLLDQLVAFGGGKVCEDEARAMLGTVARDHVVRLAELLTTLDGAEIMRFAATLDEWAPDHAQLLEELAALLVRIALKQVVPDYAGDEIYDPALLQRLAQALGRDDVQLFYQTAIVGRRDLHLAPDPRSGFEMTLLRMLAFRPADSSGERTAGTPTGARTSPLPETRPQAQPPPSAPASAPTEETRSASGATVSSTGTPAAAAAVGDEWPALLARLELSGAARQLAGHCALLAQTASSIRLALDPRNRHMCTRAQEDKLAQALTRHFGRPMRIEIEFVEPAAETPAQAHRRAAADELDATRAALESDPTVLVLKERFGASLLPDTVRPNK